MDKLEFCAPSGSLKACFSPEDACRKQVRREHPWKPVSPPATRTRGSWGYVNERSDLLYTVFLPL